MAEKELMIDTSILIDYFRKTDKKKSKLLYLFEEYDQLYISSITEFEIYNGAKKQHIDYWDEALINFKVLSFDSKAAREATRIVEQLKLKRKSIDRADLFIAATAVVNNLRFSTLNIKHFVEIDTLRLLN